MREATSLVLGGVRWWAGPGIDAARLRKLVDGIDAALAAGARDQKDGRRKASFLLALETAAPDYLLKVNHYRSLAPWRRLRRSKARAELERAMALAARGIPTPIPVAAGELRRAGLLDRCYGLVPWLPDAKDLLQVWRESLDDTASRQAWTRELGALVRRMHEAGVDQKDLAPNNFLWRSGEAPNLLAIDFERTRLRRRVATSDRIRALAKLERHFSGASAAARMRFLRAYAPESREAAREVWRQVAAFVPRLAEHDAAHWARSGTQPGRRFDGLALEVAGVVWQGFQRRGAPLEDLRAILDGGFGAAPMRIAPHCFVRRIAASDAHAVETSWGVAQALHQRRLMPEPLAVLRSRDTALLVLARDADLVPLIDAPASARGAALVVAVDRLMGIGLEPGGLRAGRVRVRAGTAHGAAARSDGLPAGTARAGRTPPGRTLDRRATARPGSGSLERRTVTESHASHDVGQFDDRRVGAHAVATLATGDDALGGAPELRQAEFLGFAREVRCALGGLFELAAVLASWIASICSPSEATKRVEPPERVVVEERACGSGCGASSTRFLSERVRTLPDPPTRRSPMIRPWRAREDPSNWAVLFPYVLPYFTYVGCCRCPRPRCRAVDLRTGAGRQRGGDRVGLALAAAAARSAFALGSVLAGLVGRVAGTASGS